ncbi:MAG TPA: VWA domain-containing protein [Vicinamibacterales bacterium]|nr:VWA domain-containing protein [Vicinamibacterales bacterium]
MKAVLAAGVAVLAGAVLAAQSQHPLRSGVELTVVTATVRDADGHLVTGLPRSAFTAYEDGVQQPVQQFSHDRVPIGLGLLLDISDSMYGRRIQDARQAVERFVADLLAPSDEFFVLAFNHEPRLLTPWTSDAAAVRAALEPVRPSGGTAIYDAVLTALPLIDHRSRERAALVVISDGADTASDATLRDVESALLRTDAFIYAVGIDSPEPQPINTRVNAQALNDLTNPTGGRSEIVHDSAELAAATARIAEELNSQYMVGYASPHPSDGQYHSIRIKVNGAGYTVRTRNGYVAAPLGRKGAGD